MCCSPDLLRKITNIIYYTLITINFIIYKLYYLLYYYIIYYTYNFIIHNNLLRKITLHTCWEIQLYAFDPREDLTPVMPGGCHVPVWNEGHQNYPFGEGTLSHKTRWKCPNLTKVPLCEFLCFLWVPGLEFVGCLSPLKEAGNWLLSCQVAGQAWPISQAGSYSGSLPTHLWQKKKNHLRENKIISYQKEA